MPSQYYSVPEQFAGKTLGQLGGQYGFRGDVLGGYLGIADNAPLVAGQNYGLGNIEGVNPTGSSELKFIGSNFAPGVSPEQAAANAKQAEISKMLQQGKTEAMSTIEAGREPLKQRYNDLIASIKGKGDEAQRQAEISSAREFGRRGIPLSSTAYDQYLQSQVLPVTTATSQTLASANLDAVNAENALNAAQAQIQQASNQQEVQSALQLYQIAQNALQNNQSLEESARQFNERLGFEKSQVQAPQQQQYATLGEGSTLFDLLAGKPLYTAPKTYKSAGGGGGGGFDESTWS